MPGFKQSSILFTLKSLRDLEQQRAGQGHDTAHVLSQLERAGGGRERKRQQQAERERAELARIEAMKQLAVARALAEAETRARAELLAQTEQHRQRLVAIEAEARARRQALVGRLGALVALVVLAAVMGVYLFKVRPETERIQSAYDRLVVAERQRADDVEQLLKKEQQRRQRLTRRLEKAETELAALKKKAAYGRQR